MGSVSRIDASNAKITPAHTPRVAVFVGATAGIGRATVRLLVAKSTSVRIYILGRNESAHGAFLDELRDSNAAAEIIWLEGQVALLSDTKRLCGEIKRREEHIDLLFMSAGFLPFGGRQETLEGLDTSLALGYWTRMLFTMLLLPLLRSSQKSEQQYVPRVISILAAGFESAKVHLEDGLDVRQTGSFAIANATQQAPTLTTLTMDRIARQEENRDIVFIHNHPGEVKTDILTKGWGARAWGATVMRTVAKPLVGLIGISAEAAGENCLYLITSAEYGGSGVPLQAGVERGLTMDKTEVGGLFLVERRFRCLQQEKVMKQLRDRDAENIVWAKTMELLKPYL